MNYLSKKDSVFWKLQICETIQLLTILIIQYINTFEYIYERISIGSVFLFLQAISALYLILNV